MGVIAAQGFVGAMGGPGVFRSMGDTGDMGVPLGVGAMGGTRVCRGVCVGGELGDYGGFEAIGRPGHEGMGATGAIGVQGI